MKKIIQNISLKALLWPGIAFVSLLIALIPAVTQSQIKKSLTEQRMAERWSEKKDAAQISVFYGNGEVEDSGYFRGIEEKIDQALITASLGGESFDEGARLWMDTVSRSGKVTVTSERGEVELNAFGVMGDFFQFHPVLLVNGTYFSKISMMSDVIMLDQETAWNLFGSFDVTGMEVKIGGIPHIVVGVFERPKGRMEEAAGLDKPLCYLSMDSLEKYGTDLGGYTYEIVLPNPIGKFGLSTVTTAVTADKKDAVIVENSSRFTPLSLFLIAKNFGLRSMSKQGVIFPYWENIARGYEDVMTALLFLELFFLLIAALIGVRFAVYYYRRRKWTVSRLIEFIKDKHYEMGTRRKRKKEEKEEIQKKASTEDKTGEENEEESLEK